jgi:hypothetical protein
MSLINGRFYMNPAYGRAVEAARAAENASEHGGLNQEGEGGHWVTIDGRHVLIPQAQAPRPQELSARDKAYLDKYYDAVAALAKVYNVDPTLVLGVGIESGFASQGTYLRTGDAFGMTGGSTKNMTTAASPAENVKQFFDKYGNEIRDTGNDDSTFLNALQGLDASGKRVQGWKAYNTVNPDWSAFIGRGIDQMRRDVPAYLSQRKVGRVS